MITEKKNWAFTEILGWKEDVDHVIQELKNEQILHGSLSSLEEKDGKCFIQYYACNEHVSRLTPREISLYNEIAFRNFVHMEYTYDGKESLTFPLNEQEGFPIKYWEWWK